MGKLSEDEKLRRKHERKAAAMNAAETKAYGPLFAEFAPVHTPDEAERNWRLTKAGVAEMGFNHPFHRSYEWILVASIERFAVSLWGTIAAEVAAGLRRTYRDHADIIRSTWSHILSGRDAPPNWRMRTEDRPEWANQYNPGGRRVICEPWVCPTPTIDLDEFGRRFPVLIRPDPTPETADEIRMEAILPAIRSAARPA
jgi:hypothetical protein